MDNLTDSLNKCSSKHLYSSDEKLKWWGPGEWVEELDELSWIYRNVRCEITRNSEIRDGVLSGFGNLCGYIELPHNHPWSSMDYIEINCDVHGGITYSRKGDDGIHRVGFDCAHFDDESPLSMKKSLQNLKKYVPCLSRDPKLKKLLESLFQGIKHVDEHKTYKNMAFVKSQCELLADQILQAIK